VQKQDEHILIAPFQEDFAGREEPDIYEILECARPYLPREGAFGEMVLNVGKTVYLAKKGAAGIIDISPFTCMNGIVCEAIYPRVSRDLGGIRFATSISTARNRTSTATWRLHGTGAKLSEKAGVGQAIVFCGLPTQTTKNHRLRDPARVDWHAEPEDSRREQGRCWFWDRISRAALAATPGPGQPRFGRNFGTDF